MAEIIDLAALLKEQKDLQTSVRKAESILAQTRQNLDEYNTKIASLIAEGKTTGNELQDECLACLGLNEDYFKKILAFDKRLSENAGKMCLLSFQWRQRIRFSGPGDSSERDYAEMHGFILGILSGERLRLNRGDQIIGLNTKVTFPFRTYVQLGFDDNPPRKLNGPLVLKPFIFDGDTEVDALLRSVIEPEERKCVVHFEDSKSRWPLHPAGLKVLEEVLTAPSEGELHTAEHI